MGSVKRPTGRGSRLAAALLVGVGGRVAAGCGDDDPAGPAVVDLSDVADLYATVTLTFDPQGSAPAADVLAVLESAGTSPTLNVGRTGSFQLFFRDPASGNITTVGGSVEPTADGIRLAFSTQAQADQFLLPRTLSLTWDPETRTLSSSATAEVSRARLLQLFPELYAEEQLFDPTPGTLTVVFRAAEEG